MPKVYSRMIGETIHSHYNNPASKDWKNYEFTGRFRYTNAQSRIGITFLSQYREEGEDAYYRIGNLNSGGNIKLIARPSATLSGTIDSGVATVPNTWYQFRIDVEDTGSQTNIRAKVWVEGESESSAYQIDAIDNNPERLTAGTIGVWASNTGRKYFDNLRVIGLGALNYRGMKGVFMEHPSEQPETDFTSMLPGTKIAVCDVQQVNIQLFGTEGPNLEWQRTAELLPDNSLNASDYYLWHRFDKQKIHFLLLPKP